MNYSLTQNELDCPRSLMIAAGELGIRVLAVGATARLLIFDLPNEINPNRTTTDWDFGVQVADWSDFDRLRERLSKPSGPFRKGPSEHRFVHKSSDTPIDLVPFGGLEVEGRICWPHSHFEMSVFGFSDALACAVELELAPHFTLPVASVPLLAVLKLFAFADRKHQTDRDLSDIWHIVKNYVVRDVEIREPPLASLMTEDFDWATAGPLQLGCDIGRSCSPLTVSRLLPIISGLTDKYGPDLSPLASRYSSASDEEAQRERISASFLWMLKGLGVCAGAPAKPNER
jgi:predicted nucleotidyltransferase